MDQVACQIYRLSLKWLLIINNNNAIIIIIPTIILTIKNEYRSNASCQNNHQILNQLNLSAMSCLNPLLMGRGW